MCVTSITCTSFHDDVLFVLFLVSTDDPSAYGCSMDVMYKMCDGHPWCTTKVRNIQIDFGPLFHTVFLYWSFAVYKKVCSYIYRNGGVSNYTKWIELSRIPFTQCFITKSTRTFMNPNFKHCTYTHWHDG